MPNPLIIGGVLLGGTFAAWRLVRREHNRLRRIMEKIAIQSGVRGEDSQPVRLERDPETGVYRPVGDPKRK